MNVILLTTRAPSKMAIDLILAGYRVFEVLEVSEVLHLCETEWIYAVVIGADVEDSDAVAVQMKHLTLRLKPGATAKDIIWELTQLFTAKDAAVNEK